MVSTLYSRCSLRYGINGGRGFDSVVAAQRGSESNVGHRDWYDLTRSRYGTTDHQWSAVKRARSLRQKWMNHELGEGGWIDTGQCIDERMFLCDA
jgi:hypothetical protein